MHACVYISEYVCACVYTCGCRYVSVRVCMLVRVGACERACVCACPAGGMLMSVAWL